jgi:hypothetical protein
MLRSNLSTPSLAALLSAMIFAPLLGKTQTRASMAPRFRATRRTSRR